jgi:exodeoxyribonuclease V alpha subunit
MIKSTVKKICLMSKEKGLNENDIQVLAPMYKGESGIDSLNLILQEIFNPKSSKKKEIKIGDITYREHDKVLQLVNDPDNNVFNGDIGYIEEIEKKNNKDVLSIMFDSGTVLYTRESLSNIRHAYAISIHKSQGSEFNHVIIPVTRDYFRMLYNKLIYTGVSRAKKSLVIIGEPESFVMAVNNNYSQNRKTDLLNKLQSLIKDN